MPKISFLCHPALTSFLGDITRWLEPNHSVFRCYSLEKDTIKYAIERSDIVFVEWANELLVYLTREGMLDGKRVIVRLHSYEVFTPSIGQIVCAEHPSETLLVQTDRDYPAVASSFGWSIRNVQRGNKKCDHESTDGSVDCQECGLSVTEFINTAADFLRDNNGIEADDPGYFDLADIVARAKDREEAEREDAADARNER